MSEALPDAAYSLTGKEVSILLTRGALRRLHVLARAFRAQARGGEQTLTEFLDWCDCINSQYNGATGETAQPPRGDPER